MKIKTFTVSELNYYIGKLISSNPLFFHVSVQGEVVNLKKTGYGYTFFSLKDQESKIRCLITHSESLKEPAEGDFISLKGKIHVYEKNGTYSILVKEFEKVGRGTAYENYLQVKEELGDLGYFDAKYKKALPIFPKMIGIITSASGAVIEDLISIISRRYPLVHLKIFDVKVQGETAVSEVIRGIGYFQNEDEVDLIILARGGGSYDELSIFNSRELAEAIFHCFIPVVSAIGHENDHFISDMVADVRAPTPSAAAELCVPELDRILKRCDESADRIGYILGQKLRSADMRLQFCCRRMKVSTPEKQVFEKRRSLEIIFEKINRQMHRCISSKRELSDIRYLKLSALNPANILQRGYAVVEKSGIRVRDIRSLAVGDLIKAHLFDSFFEAEIVQIVDLKESGSEKK
ncbi:MAG: exodeoxyribonuclease VII large subunit [Peptostreptococcaceae bacterium]|nr:exodeoxyribonuclease VII large subunit [Peptostreptococcaceae bacterium]